jgi:hypothetical protein
MRGQRCLTSLPTSARGSMRAPFFLKTWRGFLVLLLLVVAHSVNSCEVFCPPGTILVNEEAGCITCSPCEQGLFSSGE